MKKITSFSAAALWLRSGQALMCAIFLNNCFAQQQIQNVPQLGVSKIAAPSQPIQQMAINQIQPQNQPPCLADEITAVYIQQQLQQNPNYQNLINKQNNQTQQLMQINAMAKAMVVRTIPVVVHVVYNTPQQNVSDAAIFNMINILNDDFRRQNTDTSNTRAIFKPVAADVQIEFCLASKDPLGVATNGITRTSSAEVNFDPDTETNKMKDDATNGKTGWDAFKYLNIWVCNITNGTGFGVVGYAYLPTPGMHGSSIDGLVIDYNRVGGRTATHEIGHYMGLKHTWGNNPPSCGNDDGHADTPNSSDENYGCSFSANTCATPTGDQIENYMSYANCQNMFSVDQANYMNSILSGVRSSLLSSDGCEPTAPPVADFIANVTTIQAGGYVWFTDLSTGVPDTWSWNFGGGGTPNTTAVRNPVIQFNTIGTYDITLTVTNSLGSDVELKTLYINVVAPTGCDTIHWTYLLTAPLTYYSFDWVTPDDSGYVSGWNFLPSTAHAQKFNAAEFAPNTHVTGGIFDFVHAQKGGTTNSKVVFTVWDDNGVGGSPGTVLGTDTMNLLDLDSLVDPGYINLVQQLFEYPVLVSGDYYYGIQMINFDPYGGPTADTLAIVQTQQGNSAPGSAIPWTYYGGSWKDYNTYVGFNNCNLDISPYMTNLPPTASFTADTTVGCDGLTVTFNSASSVNANEYYWDIDGDNAYDWWTIDTTLTITYDTTGTFSVTLLVVGPCTGLDSVKQTNYITINPNPTLVTTKADATCGSCNGSATVTPSVGTSPYTYLWTDPLLQTTQTAGALCPGSYQVQVTDSKGCSNVSGATITDGAGLSASATATPDTCGNSVGTATVTVTGGSPGYNYSWSTSPVQTTVTATGLSAGTYNVTVTDINGCNVTTDFFSAAMVGNFVDTINITFSYTGIYCNGGNNGTATAAPAGGTNPYTYSWNTSPVQTGATASGLIAGTYAVIVTDKNTCTATDSITLTEPLLFTASILSSVNVSCNGSCDGSATVTVSGGVLPYTYLGWPYTNLCAGTYVFTVMDANGCTDTANVIISEPALLSLIFSGVVNVSCNGACDGSATPNTSGGTIPYTYSWGGGSNLCAGTYNETVTDGNGCVTTNSITITEPAPVIASVTISGSDSICAGDTVTFTATPTNGGTPAYQWQVNGFNAGTNSPTYSTTALINGDAVTCIMFSSLSCVVGSPDTSNAITMTVTSIPSSPGAITGAGTPCIASVQTYSISAVTGATTYTWTVPIGWTINFGQGTTSINVSVGGSSGNVCVTAGNSCGTSAASCSAITVNAIPSTPGSVSGTTTPCTGTTQTYSITPVAGATSYTWTVPAGWTISGIPTNSLNATVGSSSGNVCVRACNVCGCSSFSCIAVTVNTAPATPGSVSGTVSVCEGQAGEAYSITPVTGATSYTWTVPGSASITSGQGTTSITVTFGATSGNVCVTASNACGTSAASCTAVTVVPIVTASVSIAASVNPICTGDNVTFTATPANGGTPAYQWQVNGINAGTNSATYSTATLNNGDVITCIMASSLACVTGSPDTSNSITMSVSASLPAGVTISGNATICNGDNATFTASPTGGGGTPAYQWQVNGGNVGINSATYSTTTLTNGDVVTCIMTSSLTCATGSPATSNAITMTVTATVAVSVTITGNATICAGDTVAFNATPTNGGTPAYQWQVNGGNAGTNSATYSTTTLNNGDVVTCIMTSSLSCVTGSPSTSNAITMNVTSVPATPGSVTGTVSVCDGQAGEVYSISSVPGATSYTWTVPGGASITAGQGTTSITVTFGNTSGNVCVTADNSCGTSAASCTAVTVNPIVTASVTIAANINPICTGDTVVFTATPANGGTPAYQWQVNGGNVGANSATFSTTTLNDGDVVTCILTSSLTCATGSPATSNAITMNVTSIPATPGAVTGTVSVCDGQTGEVYSISTVAGATSYTWTVPAGASITSGQGTTSITVTFGTASGNVCVTAENTCGTSAASCTAVTVTTSGAASVVIAASDDSICAGDNVTFTATPANEGTPTYQWQVNGGNVGTNSSTYSTATLNDGDVVTCIMTSSLTCATGSPATSNAITITVNSLPVINTTSMVVDSSSCGNSDGSVTGITATGTGTLTYQWVNSSATVVGAAADLLNVPADTYTLTVTDAGGCTDVEIVNMAPCIPIGILEMDLANSLHLYPNPTKGVVILEFTFVMPKDIKVTVYNVIGKVVLIAEWKNVGSGINTSASLSVHTIDLSGKANGIYFLNIQTEEEVIVRKVSVVR